MSEVWDFPAYAFELGLDQIRTAYRAAMEGCEVQISKARREAEIFREANSPFSSEDSEEWLQLVDLGCVKGLAEAGKSEIREAFVLSAFHHWERWMRRRTGEQGSFTTLSKAAQDIGYTHPRPGILNSLCNLLKHDNVDHAEALASQWSELFGELPHGVPGQREWKLAIQDHHIEQVSI